MSELVPFTAEDDTTSERFFWDGVIRCLDAIADVCAGDEEQAFELYETLEGLREETEEDALMLLYNYTLNVTVPPGTSSNLSLVEDFLRANGLIE